MEMKYDNTMHIKGVELINKYAASMAFSCIPAPSGPGKLPTTGNAMHSIITMPNDPSTPTTNSGGSFFDLRNFSSMTICVALINWDTTTNTFPNHTMECGDAVSNMPNKNWPSSVLPEEDDEDDEDDEGVVALLGVTEGVLKILDNPIIVTPTTVRPMPVQ